MVIVFSHLIKTNYAGFDGNHEYYRNMICMLVKCTSKSKKSL